MSVNAGDSSDSETGKEQLFANEENRHPWLGTFATCFSSVIMRVNDTPKVKELPWELPFDSLTGLSYLGAGAQGVVFTAQLNGEMVAVKKVRDKLETSMKHLRKLNHENVVRFRGVCTRPPCCCVVMEYCQYGSLYQFLHSDRNLLPVQLLDWAKGISLGMAYLHANKIIHRDLKSPNILLSDDLVPKISDFGTSREWNNNSTVMSFNGTVGWMAPEVIRQDRCSDRVDVWAFGVILWEMMTRQLPFLSIEPHAVLWGVGSDTLTLPVPSGCPELIQILINNCWARDPKSRPPFKVVLATLEMATPDFEALNPQTFADVQAAWAKDVNEKIKTLYNRDNPSTASSLFAPGNAGDIPKRQEVILHSRQIYEQHMQHANDLFMEVCSVRLQLEQRERIVAEAEKRLQACRCGAQPNAKKQPTSSSSAKKPVVAKQPRKKKSESKSKLFVRYVDKDEGSTYSVAMKNGVNKDDDIENGNPVQKKDTIVEQNGNVVMPKKGSGKQKKKINKPIPDVAFI